MQRSTGRILTTHAGSLPRPVALDDAWITALWDRMLPAADVEQYSRYCGLRIEAANVRHEHHLWEDIKLPEGKLLIPGVVSHATNVLEHPELVAERITRFADRVGRENVLAGADCALGGRVHPQLAWAKLQALVEGARLATTRLWRN